MDHLWLRVEEGGDLSAVLHPEYRRGVNEDPHGQNRQEGRRLEELAAELASEGLILVLYPAVCTKKVQKVTSLAYWSGEKHIKKLKSPRQG